MSVPADLRAEIAAEIARAAPDRAPQVPGEVYGRRLAAARGSRRAAGAYYTPPHLVDFAVDRVLAPLCDGRDADAALSLRIVDPACGAGAFLLGAARWLARRYGERVGRLAAARCLYGVDVDPIAVELCRMSLELAAGAPGRIEPGDGVVGPFPLLAPFDAVIGNPPWGQKGFRWPDAARAYVRAHYRCGRGTADPYAVFVERAIGLLRDGGRWGLVLPDIVLLKNPPHVRDVILDTCSIEHIADAGRAFEQVNLDTVVIVARRGPAIGHRVRVCRALGPDGPDPAASAWIDQATFSALPRRTFNIHLTDEALALWRKLDALPTLGERFEMHEGVHTGNARDKLFLPAKAHRDCVPIVVGKGEIDRFRVDWAGTWLDRHPDALDRRAGDYANLGRPEWHQRKKLLVRRTGDRVVAAFDDRGLYASNNLFVVLPKREMSDTEQRAYVALLNSRLMTWFFRTTVPRTGKLFAELKLQHLRAFPAPPAKRWAGQVEALARLGPDADAAVCELYGLNDDEIALL